MRRPHQFDFKEFSITQSRSAMKICTDSCVFGALINPHKSRTILDIGTGTGLLSLMLAQRTSDDVLIDAIDIDSEAILDAKENTESSPWNDRINVHHGDICTWNAPRNYDLIICNPPFHVRSTPSANPKELAAHHADNTLPFISLIESISQLSHKNTQTWILLPIIEMKEFIEISIKYSLYLQECILIYHASNEEAIRKICCFSKQKQDACIERTFAYRTHSNGSYTEEFITAMSPYYLFL
jgi:tRNA1Val (adenine37-N6)-methyltransferase